MCTINLGCLKHSSNKFMNPATTLRIEKLDAFQHFKTSWCFQILKQLHVDHCHCLHNGDVATCIQGTSMTWSSSLLPKQIPWSLQIVMCYATKQLFAITQLASCDECSLLPLFAFVPFNFATHNEHIVQCTTLSLKLWTQQTKNIHYLEAWT
jgi:hypothetical protein